MRTARIIACLLFFIFGRAFAQSGMEESGADGNGLSQAVYSMTDKMNNKNNRVESWKVMLAEDGELVTLKEPFRNTAAQQIQTDGKWWNKMHTEGAETYLRERYITHPFYLRPGEQSYGFVEERSVQGDILIRNWPIFYKVQGTESVWQLTVHGFLPGNIHLLITRDYKTGNGYFLPIKESQELLEGDTTILHYEYARIR